MRAAAAKLLFAALALVASAISACADEQIRPLVIAAAPTKFATGEDQSNTVGRLTHRGTLRLTSPDKDFGGISGLIVSGDGERFLAVTDSSHWLTGKLGYADGKLTSATGVEIGPLLDLDGRPLDGKAGDAEGLAGSIDGDVFVSFERNHRIWRYRFGAKGLAASAQLVQTPPELAQAPDNSGLEGIVQLSDGRLLALTEAFKDDAGNFRGWLVAADGKKPAEALALKPRAPFELTDVRQLPSGDVLTLERRFNQVGGIGFAMRRIPSASIKPDAVLDGDVVADVGMNYIIDNMEGLAVRRDADGKVLVYAVSDDNFNPSLQRTLLMMFELKD